MNKIYDFIILGGGVTGSSIAYGLSKFSNKSIAIVDGYDKTYRASVGNYGLTWLQSKGYNQPEYARTTENVFNSWHSYKEEIEKNSGIDLEYSQTGGLTFCEDESQYENLNKKISTLNSYYQYEESKTQMLKHDELKKIYPGLGKDIYGASYNKLDGLLNPLNLLKSQLKLAQKQGVESISNFYAVDIKKEDSIYVVISKDGRVLKSKELVLASGLSNKQLGARLGLNIPLGPQKGHILVAQKMPQLNLIPCFNVRQTNDGTLLLGVSNEDMGFDISIDEDIVSSIVRKSMKILPMLKDIKIIRSWAALRVMPEDEEPIYDTIDNSLHIISTHSAITLAPLHSVTVAKSILNGEMPEELKKFSLDRFKKD